MLPSFAGVESVCVGIVQKSVWAFLLGKGKQKLCSPGWPRTPDPPASASFSKSYRWAPPPPAGIPAAADLLKAEP